MRKRERIRHKEPWTGDGCFCENDSTIEVLVCGRKGRYRRTRVIEL